MLAVPCHGDPTEEAGWAQHRRGAVVAPRALSESTPCVVPAKRNLQRTLLSKAGAVHGSGRGPGPQKPSNGHSCSKQLSWGDSLCSLSDQCRTVEQGGGRVAWAPAGAPSHRGPGQGPPCGPRPAYGCVDRGTMAGGRGLCRGRGLGHARALGGQEHRRASGVASPGSPWKLTWGMRSPRERLTPTAQASGSVTWVGWGACLGLHLLCADTFCGPAPSLK